MNKSRKVNARITGEVDRKLQEIVRATGSSMSEVIMQAIELYYRHGGGGPTAESPQNIAKRHNLVGCKRGPGDLSTNYKKYYCRALEHKHDHH